MVPTEEEAPDRPRLSDKDKLQVPMRREMCDLHGREAEKLGISDFLLVSI